MKIQAACKSIHFSDGVYAFLRNIFSSHVAHVDPPALVQRSMVGKYLNLKHDTEPSLRRRALGQIPRDQHFTGRNSMQHPQIE